jgi:hypothetical protein
MIAALRQCTPDTPVKMADGSDDDDVIHDLAHINTEK